MTGGPPSLRRNRPTVTWTVLVNGSAFSSQAWDRRSSALRTPRGGFEQGFEHAEFLRREIKVAAVAGDGPAERVQLDPGRSQDPGVGCGLAAA